MLIYRIMQRPERTEYAEFYAGYVSAVPETDIVGVLAAQPDELAAVIGGLPEEKGHYAYADGKWTIKELLGHVVDGERVFGYRAHRISHGDATRLSGFDQDLYVSNGRANLRGMEDIVEEFASVRRANVIMLETLRSNDWNLGGTASDAYVTVRAIAYIMAGHVRHHMAILRDRYLV